MQNQLNLTMNVPTQRNHLYCSWIFSILPALALCLFLQLPALSLAASNSVNGKEFALSRFLAVEIEGVSLNTPLKNIPAILESHGYTQTGDATYLKQAQIPGQRKSVYRIEIDDNAAFRKIEYFRGKSGGRVKSPVAKERPVPPNEATPARKLYEMVCVDVTAETQASRSCEPLTDSHIQFGQDDYLKIDDSAAMRLNASAAATTIGLTYFKK